MVPPRSAASRAAAEADDHSLATTTPPHSRMIPAHVFVNPALACKGGVNRILPLGENAIAVSYQEDVVSDQDYYTIKNA